jgi:hypothetical protein
LKSNDFTLRSQIVTSKLQVNLNDHAHIVVYALIPIMAARRTYPAMAPGPPGVCLLHDVLKVAEVRLTPGTPPEAPMVAFMPMI